MCTQKDCLPGESWWPGPGLAGPGRVWEPGRTGGRWARWGGGVGHLRRKTAGKWSILGLPPWTCHHPTRDPWPWHLVSGACCCGRNRGTQLLGAVLCSAKGLHSGGGGLVSSNQLPAHTGVLHTCVMHTHTHVCMCAHAASSPATHQTMQMHTRFHECACTHIHVCM